MTDMTPQKGGAPAPATDANRFDEDYDPAASYFELTAGPDVSKFGMRYVSYFSREKFFFVCIRMCNQYVIELVDEYSPCPELIM